MNLSWKMASTGRSSNCPSAQWGSDNAVDHTQPNRSSWRKRLRWRGRAAAWTRTSNRVAAEFKAAPTQVTSPASIETTGTAGKTIGRSGRTVRLRIRRQERSTRPSGFRLSIIVTTLVFIMSACGFPPQQTSLSSPGSPTMPESQGLTQYRSSAIFRSSDAAKTSPDGRSASLTGTNCEARLIVSELSTFAISITASTPTALRDASAWSGAHTTAACTSVSSGGGTDPTLMTFSVGGDNAFGDAWLYLRNVAPGEYTIGAGIVGKDIEPSCPCTAVATIHQVQALGTLPQNLAVHGTGRACYADGPNITGIRFQDSAVFIRYRSGDGQVGTVQEVEQAGGYSFRDSTLEWNSGVSTSLGIVADSPPTIVGIGYIPAKDLPQQSCAWDPQA
jgi:hypothetical protein